MTENSDTSKDSLAAPYYAPLAPMSTEEFIAELEVDLKEYGGMLSYEMQEEIERRLRAQSSEILTRIFVCEQYDDYDGPYVQEFFSSEPSAANWLSRQIQTYELDSADIAAEENGQVGIKGTISFRYYPVDVQL